MGQKESVWRKSTCPTASLSEYSLRTPSARIARGFLILWKVVLLFKASKHLEQLAPIPSTVNEKKSKAPLTGCTMNPRKPRPRPLASPRRPFCLALSTGFVTTPDTPNATPCARASVPWIIPSPTPVILLDHTWNYVAVTLSNSYCIHNYWLNKEKEKLPALNVIVETVHLLRAQQTLY